MRGLKKNQKDITVIQNIGSKFMFRDGLYHKKTKGGDIRTNEVRKILCVYDWIENDLNRCL